MLSSPLKFVACASVCFAFPCPLSPLAGPGAAPPDALASQTLRPDRAGAWGCSRRAGLEGSVSGAKAFTRNDHISQLLSFSSGGGARGNRQQAGSDISLRLHREIASCSLTRPSVCFIPCQQSRDRGRGKLGARVGCSGCCCRVPLHSETSCPSHPQFGLGEKRDPSPRGIQSEFFLAILHVPSSYSGLNKKK